MISTDKKAKIFEEFLRGKPRKKLASEHGVSIRTIERWSAEEQWVSHRTDYFRGHFKKMLEERPAMLVSDSLVEDRLFEFFLDASGEYKAFCNGEIPKKHMKFKIKDTIRIATAYATIRQTNLQRAEYARSVGNFRSTDPQREFVEKMDKKVQADS